MISIIVPVRNAAATLGECLEALARQTLGAGAYEVIVVNDGSTDGTAAVAARYPVRCLEIPASGPAAARNHGVQAAHGELVLFTDGDCAPAPDWAARMAAPLARPEVVGARGVYRTRQRSLIARFVQQEYQDKYDRTARQPRIDFIDTYSAAYRRSVFLENGGFETAFAAPSVEDQEFSFRLAEKGYRLVFAPDAVVYHQHDATLGEYLRRKFSIGYWKAFLLRWHPEKALGDSHTPLSQRAQLGLLALAGLLGAAGLLLGAWPAGRWLAWAGAAALGAFYLSALPFLVKLLRRDAAVAAIAPAMLLARAGALGLGLAVGLVGLRARQSPRRAALAWQQRLLKRALDVAAALAGLIVCAPLLAALALWVRLDSPGPALFVQERVGENGRRFRMVKLRSMAAGAEKMAAEATDETAPGPKPPNDPRVTRAGRFLRRWSLDELPQFWNVLRGEMSLVGPRPEEPRIVARYSDWHRARLRVKPGMTGPMQISGRGALPLDERVRLELDYIEGYSLWRDVVILARTIPAVVRGEGAF
jgi:lipopolysaccharide/colanic/teichoic acid biosynthesis glycosyltransferase/glycosyltransferase involved in cell wall biosynthesis